MTSKFIVGVMGPGEAATPEDNSIAFQLGAAIAKEGWIVLTGGRAFGVMNAAMKGAKENGGTTLGILPGSTAQGSSEYADIKIISGMNSARNLVNILTSHVIVVIGMAAGTASEVSLAIKTDKRVILLKQNKTTSDFFKAIGTYKIKEADTVQEAIAHIKEVLSVNR